MKAGDKVLCVLAREHGIPLKEGETYTVKRTFVGNQRDDEETINGMENVPGVELIEVSGYFCMDRFRDVSR